jgi:hypothetical protein
VGDLLTGWVIVSFSRRSLLHGVSRELGSVVELLSEINMLQSVFKQTRCSPSLSVAMYRHFHRVILNESPVRNRVTIQFLDR